MLKNDLEFRVSLTRACVGTYKGGDVMEYIEIKQFKEKVPPDAEIKFIKEQRKELLGI